MTQTKWLCRTCQTPCASSDPFCSDACSPPLPVPAWLEREREQFQAVINDWADAYAKLAREHEILKADANRRLCDD